MPANSGPSARASTRSTQTGSMGAMFVCAAAVTKLEPRADYGGDGKAGVATVGRIDSGGPVFNSKLTQPYPFSQRFGISGTTYDSVGAALANCTVLLLNRSAGIVVRETISDGSGLFSFTVDDNSTERWGIAAGSGVAGATIGPLTYTVV
jgi:hypothetical protein